MKTKQALKIENGLKHGVLYPQHMVRKAALQLKRPLEIKYQSEHSRWLNVAITYDPKTGISAEPEIGSHVSRVFTDLVDVSSYLKLRINVSFNDTEVIITPISKVIEVYDAWNAETERARQEYLNSNEYKEMQAEAARRDAEHQKKIDSLLVSLPNIIQNESEIMNWAKEFADIADNIHLNYDKAKLSQQLQDAGWRESAHVIKDEEEKKKIVWTKTMMAEYIMGQFIHCLNIGMPPHPITCTFVDKYNQMAA